MTASSNTNNGQQTSVLVIGATGLTGKACILKLSEQVPKPSIHAFCRDESKLDNKMRSLCTSVVQGNARKEQDIRRALKTTHADWIIVAIGNGEDVSKSDIRTASAHAIVNVLKGDPAFSNVRTMLVSSNGAGSSKIVVGMGIGMLISHHLRHVLADHTGQEAAFRAVKDRTLVIRPTALTTDAPTGKLVEFGDTVKAPSIKTDRADVAEWIADAIVTEKGPCIVNLTGVKKQ